MIMDGFADFTYVLVESEVLVEPDSETLYARYHNPEPEPLNS